MAQWDLKELVQKLVARLEFRQRFRHDPEGLFGGYDLTAQERAAVLSVGARYGFSTLSRSLRRIASIDWWAGPSP